MTGGRLSRGAMEVCCEQHGESKELLWAATMQEYLVKFTGGTGLKVFKEEISLQ